MQPAPARHPSLAPHRLTMRRKALPSRLTGIAAFLLAGGAFGQAEPAAEKRGKEAQLSPVVVTGSRASLSTALDIRREKAEIVDSVVADDIQKLPDVSVTEALQRITGIQIGRDRGEGAAVTIRGLTQMETTLNGREIFTAGTGRNLDFSDIPSELLAGIDVYKTSSADQIEGGVGGLVDLRTRRPFDFPRSTFAASARAVHADLADRTEGQFSALASRRWTTGNAGEAGLLVSLAHQKRAWREDQKNTGNPVARTDLVPGRTVFAPSATSETVSAGTRERNAGNLTLQWRPNDALELYAEGSYAELLTRQESHQINVFASSSFAPGSATLFPGTNDLAGITWTNAPLSILSFARDTVDRTKQLAVGGSWRGEALTLEADLSHTKSENDLFFSGPFLAGTAASFTHDLSSDIPRTAVSGTDLLDPANLRYTGLAYRARPFEGELTAARLDGEYRLDGFVHTFAAGTRLARRSATNAPGLIFGDVSLTGVAATDRPQFLEASALDDFLGGRGTSITDFLVGNLEGARDPAALRAAFGVSTPLPVAGDPLGVWKIEEDTRAAYLMAEFAGEHLPIDGNLGLRIVQTRSAVSGSSRLDSVDPGTGATIRGPVVPIEIDNESTDYLPSVNLRYELADDLFLRAAASKTLTRPNFDQLSPSLVLLANSIDPALNQGAAGNPELEPVRSDNLDLALERYFGRGGAMYLTLFRKRVDGFVTMVSSPELHNGVLYQVSRPRNSGGATIKGAEIGYQQFFDFLPGWLRGFGIQANYTFVDSETASPLLGQKVPLQNLSRHSYNLVGMYERGRVSARVAYNWRDKYLSSIVNIAGVGALPVYTEAYGWLDASVGYRPNDRLTITLEGNNLLGTVRRAYYGTSHRHQSTWVNDRYLGLTASTRF